MNTVSSALVLAALALVAIAPAHASPRVSRCAGSDGASIYTDGSCRAIGAEAVPMSAQLLRTLVRDGEGSGEVAPVGELPPAAAKDQVLPVCARTPGQLATALRQTLGAGDVNELAAVYDWTGISGRQSRAILQRLERMSGRPLIDGHYFAASDGVVQLVQGSASSPTVTELAVRRRAGCLLLAF